MLVLKIKKDETVKFLTERGEIGHFRVMDIKDGGVYLSFNMPKQVQIKRDSINKTFTEEKHERKI